VQIFFNRQHGLSLIELMIALALGTIITTSVVQLFVSNSKTYKLLIGQSRMQESARFALEFIGRAVRVAGHRGCFNSNDAIYTTMNPTPAEPKIPYEFDLRTGVAGYEATGDNIWSPPLTTLPTTTNGVDTNVYITSSGTGKKSGIDTSKIVSGTDIVTLRGLSHVDARVAENMPTGQEDIVVQIPNGGLEFDDDYLVMIHDCVQGTIFRITNIDLDSPSANKAIIAHGTGDPDRVRNDFLHIARSDTFSTDASVTGILTHTFFIAPGVGVNNRGDTSLSLWRKTGLQRPVELVEGVEDLQILFGVDTDKDRIPNQYRKASSMVDFTQVITIRVSVTTNSVDAVGAITEPTHGCDVQVCLLNKEVDGLLRRTFTQTFMMRNSA